MVLRLKRNFTFIIKKKLKQMKIILTLSITLLIQSFAISQKLSDIKWVHDIDISEYKVSKDTSKLTDFFLTHIDKNTSDIAINDTNFATGCLGPKKHSKLNWIAIGNQGHSIISMSFSGRGAQWTEYFFIKQEDIWSIHIRTPKNISLSLLELIENIRENDYKLYK